MACREFEMGRVIKKSFAFQFFNNFICIAFLVNKLLQIVWLHLISHCLSVDKCLFVILLIEKEWTVLATDARSALCLWTFHCLLCKKMHWIVSYVNINRSLYLNTTSWLCKTWFFNNTRQITVDFFFLPLLVCGKLWCFLFLFKDSEENKGDYVTRMLRVTYQNVSIVYAMTKFSWEKQTISIYP